MNKKIKVVYTHSINGEIFYVGCGNTVRPYIKNNRNRVWKNVVSGNGGLFDVAIVSEHNSKSEALEAELELILELLPYANVQHNKHHLEGNKYYLKANESCTDFDLLDPQIKFILSKKEKAEFKDACWWQRESMGEVLREAAKKYVKRHREKGIR